MLVEVACIQIALYAQGTYARNKGIVGNGRSEELSGVSHNTRNKATGIDNSIPAPALQGSKILGAIAKNVFYLWKKIRVCLPTMKKSEAMASKKCDLNNMATKKPGATNKQ